MKRILPYVLVLSYACNKNDLTTIEIHLINSLGTITVNVPARYDTSFSWTHYSDCNICHIQKHRIQSQINPIIKESGFFWVQPTDSVDRFTISYTLYSNVREGVTIQDGGYHPSFKDGLAYERKDMKLLKDTSYQINGRYFSVYAFGNSDSILKKEVVAITFIKGYLVNFSCELMTGKNDEIAQSFFANSIDLIHSIKIH